MWLPIGLIHCEWRVNELIHVKQIEQCLFYISVWKMLALKKTNPNNSKEVCCPFIQI